MIRLILLALLLTSGCTTAVYHVQRSDGTVTDIKLDKNFQNYKYGALKITKDGALSLGSVESSGDAATIQVLTDAIVKLTSTLAAKVP